MSRTPVVEPVPVVDVPVVPCVPLAEPPVVPVVFAALEEAPAAEVDPVVVSADALPVEPHPMVVIATTDKPIHIMNSCM